MSKMTRFEKYLTQEIGIEFKACLYFYCVLFFYCIVMFFQGFDSVSILTMAEIIASNYVICYIQVYVFHNFDEADRLGINEGMGILVCTGAYTLLSYCLSWFERKPDITLYFALFLVFTYLCVFLVYKIKRNIDTKELNNLLTEYKKKEW